MIIKRGFVLRSSYFCEKYSKIVIRNCLHFSRLVIICDYETTVYKAGLSTVGHLNNLVTKIITKYSVLTTYKIPKKYNFCISNFFGKIKFISFRNFISCKNWIF